MAGRKLFCSRPTAVANDEDTAAVRCGLQVLCLHALQVAEAVYYFGKSKRTNNGVRLAKKHGMDQELLSLALQASPLQPLCALRAQHCLEGLSKASWLLWLYHCGTVS